MPQVDLQAYRYFCAVADTGSVRAAADMCFVTQPAVSRQIALMERTLGVRLFNRRSSGMEITAVGQALYPEAQRLLNQADRANRMLEYWNGARAGLRVACLDTTLNLIIAPFVAETGTAIVDIRTERAKDLDSTLDAGVDLVVSTAQAARSRAVRRLCNIPLTAQYGRNLQLPADDAVELAVLADYGLLPGRRQCRRALGPQRRGRCRHRVDGRQGRQFWTSRTIDRRISIDCRHHCGTAVVRPAECRTGLARETADGRAVRELGRTPSRVSSHREMRRQPGAVALE
jgi:DNA-binding transcriptional LysR family regulator